MDINLFEPITLIIITTFAIFVGFMLGLSAKEKVLLKQKEKEFEKLIEDERKAKVSAEEAITARDEFLAIASHELKTPLTTITLRIQSTLDSILNQSLASFSGEKLVSSLTVAQEQTRRLQMLIKDLLNFSLITTGKLNLELKEGDLVELVKATIDRFEDHLKLAGCTLKLKTNEPIIGLWDQIRLEQAVSNLLTNAIKYGEGGLIEVEVKKEKAKAKIIVSDNGVGIESNQQKIIFDRFRRGIQDGKHEGLGVGLFIVKQIAEAHGGKVSVSSKLGKGSKFTMEIPTRKSQLLVTDKNKQEEKSFALSV